MIEFLKEIDTNVLLFFNSYHSSFFDSFMMLATQKFVWVPFYVSLAYMLILNQGWKRGIVWLLGIALTIALADQICASVIRPQVERLRPSNVNNPISEFVQIVGDYRAAGYSFPSCHGANSFALASIICCVVKRRDVRALILTWAVLHVYTRIYLGVHYPGDILVGSLIGALIGWIVYLAFNWLLGYFKISVPKVCEPEESGEIADVQFSGGALVCRRIVSTQFVVPLGVFLLTLLYFTFCSI